MNADDILKAAELLSGLVAAKGAENEALRDYVGEIVQALPAGSDEEMQVRAIVGAYHRKNVDAIKRALKELGVEDEGFDMGTSIYIRRRSANRSTEGDRVNG